jgi:glycogen operon protein
MLQAGDEFGRTQRGNNNAYCQDNETSWVDWDLAKRRVWLTNFVRQLLTLRKHAPGLRRDTFLKGARQVDREHKDVSWRHPLGHEMNAGDWHDENARALGVLIGHAFADPHGTPNGHLLFLCNTGDTPVDFRLPAPKTNAVWQVVFDTARWRSSDFGKRLAAGESCVVSFRSCVLLADGDAPLSVRSFSLQT